MIERRESNEEWILRSVEEVMRCKKGEGLTRMKCDWNEEQSNLVLECLYIHSFRGWVIIQKPLKSLRTGRNCIQSHRRRGLDDQVRSFSYSLLSALSISTL